MKTPPVISAQTRCAFSQPNGTTHKQEISSTPSGYPPLLKQLSQQNKRGANGGGNPTAHTSIGNLPAHIGRGTPSFAPNQQDVIKGRQNLKPIPLAENIGQSRNRVNTCYDKMPLALYQPTDPDDRVTSDNSRLSNSHLWRLSATDYSFIPVTSKDEGLASKRRWVWPEPNTHENGRLRCGAKIAEARERFPRSPTE